MENNAEWLEQRQKVITATDCLFVLKEFSLKLQEALCQVNTFDRTRFQLYTEKSISTEQFIDYQLQYKKLFPEKAKIMQEGKDRESEIAEFVKADLGFELTPNGNNIAFLEGHKIGATPDYYASLQDPAELQRIAVDKTDQVEITGDYSTVAGNGIVECKLTRSLDDEKLFKFEFQAQQQLLCTGLNWVCLAIGIKEAPEVGSPIAKRIYHFVVPNKQFQGLLVESVNSFWKWFEDVKAGKEALPQWNRHNEKDAILHHILRTDIAKLVEEYIEAQKAWKHWECVKDVLKSRVQCLMGNTTNSLEVEISTGDKVKVNQVYTKETFYTEKDIKALIEKSEMSLKKAKETAVGSLKSPSKLFRFTVDN